MTPQSADEIQIRELLFAFSNAAAAGSPHMMAATLCSNAAENLLDEFPDPNEVVTFAALPEIEVQRVQVFGNLALGRITNQYRSDEVMVMTLRRESGRWTICGDAEQELSLDQLEEQPWTPEPELTKELVSRVQALRAVPIGSLDDGGVAVLLTYGQGLDLLLPNAMRYLNDINSWPDVFPWPLLTAAMTVTSEYWTNNPLLLVRMHALFRDIGTGGRLFGYAPAQGFQDGCIEAFLRVHPDTWDWG
ncbi:contact-dependent growth inhibition system immunity protein [Nocardia sp. NPDC058058]|uniref:contact-dependent growth inhibition system immunity protein n=1 Tax=Nocardia sp. NPDC058058 TaxID=3346317 RepID=UPI0036DBB9F5